jgi:catechol 2,3-dioxygenase-like lactoylglutathione lyase family enzyme
LSFSCRYVALHVAGLEAAETFFRRVFDMDLLFRESMQDDGRWYALRDGIGWAEATQRSIAIGMVALQRDQFVLALFEGGPSAGAVYEICIAVESAEIDVVRARLPDDAVVDEFEPGWLRFLDPFGFRWAVRDRLAPFRSSGEVAGRWLD